MLDTKTFSTNKYFLDSLGGCRPKTDQVALLGIKRPVASKPVLYSRGKISDKFFTEDSGLYLTPGEKKMIQRGIRINNQKGKWDGIGARIIENYQVQRALRKDRTKTKDILLEKYFEYREKISFDFSLKSSNFWEKWSLTELWNFSLVGAIILGMVSMSLIYRFLGPGVSAKDLAAASGNQKELIIENPNVSQYSEVLGASIEKNTEDSEEMTGYIENVIDEMKTKKEEEFEKEIRSLVKGYPIEKMVPQILKKDRIVAAFLIGIAKKESNWGKRVPVLNGRDCYNYWGYRGLRKLMGTGGHTCFNSREDAVDTVAKRIETLVKKSKLDTPGEMVIWKCGSACQKDDPGAVRKWISDVDLYFDKLNK